jgi:hypothetical protein
MGKLISAITSHDLQGIAEAYQENPSSAFERVNGWLPIEWAEKTGNCVTQARTARILSQKLPSLSPRAVLKKYIAIISATDYEVIPRNTLSSMIWDAVYKGKTFKVDRWNRDLIASPEHALDVRYLIEQCDILSTEELGAFIENA